MMTKNDKAPVIKQSQTALSFVAIKGVSPNAIKCHKIGAKWLMANGQ